MRYDIADARETVLKQGEWFIALAVSPDGTQLAYLKSVRTDEERRKKEYPSIVEVMPASGGASRVILRDSIWLTGHRYNTLAWTPDGRSPCSSETTVAMARAGRWGRAPADGHFDHGPAQGALDPSRRQAHRVQRWASGRQRTLGAGELPHWAEKLTRRILHASLTKT